MDGREGRRFVCPECGNEGLVCSRCDRGQRYCGAPCRERARRESIKRARLKHRCSEEGRLDHRDAERRRRAATRVADQGSENLSTRAEDPSPTSEKDRDERVATEATGRPDRERDSASPLRTRVVLASSSERRARADAFAATAPSLVRCLACRRPMVVARILGKRGRRSSRGPPVNSLRDRR